MLPFFLAMLNSLVYHAGALGDFVTTLPAMNIWRRLHPADRIVLLGMPGPARLASRALFDEVWDARSSQFAPLFADAVDPGSALAARFASFHSALLFSAASSPLASNLSRLGVARIVRQDPFPTEQVHVVDYHLCLFEAQAVSAEDRLPRVSLSAGTLEVPSNTVAIHPGSGDPRKNWPVSSFASLSAAFEEAGLAVRWIIGPSEEETALPAGAQAWSNVPLGDLAAALAACRLFVGNDSGVSHLAAAAGCPTVALFGPTDPVIWAPRGRFTRVIPAPDGKLSSLVVETVLSKCLECLRR